MKKLITTTILLFLLVTTTSLAADSSLASESLKPPTLSNSANGLFPGLELTKDYLLYQYLERMGYRVLSDNGQGYSYQLTKEFLLTYPGTLIWGVQSFDPTPYLGQIINVRKFIVINHPLDKHSEEGKTEVHVLVVNDIPLGGTSLPYSKETLLGGIYSLDGRT